MYNKNVKGFTLVEIMIVVAIIALLATIAIPGILRSRQTANESNAMASLKAVATASETFRAAQTTGVYPANVGILADANPTYIQGFSGTGTTRTKSGYTFSLASDANGFMAAADDTGASANIRNFCIDQRGDLYAQTGPYTVAAATNCGGTQVTQ